MNTTYDLSAEDKVNVFLSQYNPLNVESNVEQTEDSSDWLPEWFRTTLGMSKPVVLKAKVVEETSSPEPAIEANLTRMAPPIETKVPFKTTESNSSYFDITSKWNPVEGAEYHKAFGGEKGVYDDRSDPTTVLNSVMRRAKTYNTNPMNKEIERLDFTEEDKQYLKLLSYIESTGNSSAKSGSHGGLYQFDNLALQTIRMKPAVYYSNTINQHTAALKYKAYHLDRLGLSKYIGKEFRGIVMTENGLAAALHLLGLQNVKRFIESDGKYIAVDRNNTPITAYLGMFL